MFKRFPWEAALSEDEKVRAFHVWHEHCTVATASAYAVASEKVRRGIGDMRAGCHPADDSAGDRRQQQNTTRRFRG
jgi:hypothetical protein